MQEEMVDRFGEYPKEVEYLFRVAEMKIFAKDVHLESIKQTKNEVTILVSEKGTPLLDGSKVVELCQTYGRMMGYGMDGYKLKITMNIKNVPVEKWFSIAYNIIQNLKEAKKKAS